MLESNVLFERRDATPFHSSYHFPQIGLSNGCTRCNFSVLDWNKPSIEFYKQCGAVDLTGKEGWLAFRMERAVMQAFVEKK